MKKTDDKSSALSMKQNLQALLEAMSWGVHVSRGGTFFRFFSTTMQEIIPVGMSYMFTSQAEGYK